LWRTSLHEKHILGHFVHGKRNRSEGNHCAGNAHGIYFTTTETGPGRTTTLHAQFLRPQHRDKSSWRVEPCGQHRHDRRASPARGTTSRFREEKMVDGQWSMMHGDGKPCPPSTMDHQPLTIPVRAVRVWPLRALMKQVAVQGVEVALRWLRRVVLRPCRDAVLADRTTTLTSPPRLRRGDGLDGVVHQFAGHLGNAVDVFRVASTGPSPQAESCMTCAPSSGGRSPSHGARAGGTAGSPARRPRGLRRAFAHDRDQVVVVDHFFCRPEP